MKQRHSHWKKAATNATITRENGAFVITDEVQGKTIDAEASVKAIETYLNKKWNKKEASVDLVSISDVPDVTREQLETIQDTLGTFTTYCGSGGGRVQNIESGNSAYQWSCGDAGRGILCQRSDGALYN